jgi:hypothetical protein
MNHTQNVGFTSQISAASTLNYINVLDKRGNLIKMGAHDYPYS